MQENFGDVLSHLQELKEGQKELISGQNAIFGDTQEINEKLDMLIDASQLQYKKQQKIPKDLIHPHEMVPLKKQDYVAPLGNVTHPGTWLFIFDMS